jgi:histidinol-phosphate phosphatase family protein
VGVSNQPAAAKGIVALAELQAVQARVVELFGRAGVAFDRFSLCFHHPAGTVAELAIECDCRKPAPGMLRDALRDLSLDAAESWLVGDTDTDITAGRAAGVRPILIQNPASAHKRTVPEPALITAPDLPSAVDLILQGSR